MNRPDGIEPFFEPLESLQRLLSRFNDRGVIIGGAAFSILGKARYTEDIDAMLLLSVKDIPRLLEAASEEGMEPRIENAADTNIDLSLGILPFEEEMVKRSVVYQIDAALQIRLPTPEDLIIMKAVAHRPKDLDIRRVEKWVKQFAEVLEMPSLWDDIAGIFK
jgi:hypothetical protein